MSITTAVIGIAIGYAIIPTCNKLRPFLCKVIPHNWDHSSWDGDFRFFTCRRCQATERRPFPRLPVHWRFDTTIKETDSGEAATRT